MAIAIRRFEKEKADAAHNDTILASKVLPDGLNAPFDDAYGYLTGGNSMELHAHPTEEFYMVLSGNGYVTVGDERQAVGPGDVIAIPRNALHTMTAAGGPEDELLWAAFWWA